MFALPWGQCRYPEDYKFINFGRGLLPLHHHAFSFSSACVVVEKTSTLRIMKFTILVKVFLVYITMHLVLLIYM
jgi:hypothetical protein